ncbi:MAG: histidine kinase dimerization/phosphoacceptor domain -containing protein [Devosia sp.]
MTNETATDQVEALLETSNLADALESERFKQFLDHVPFAVAVSELHPSERLTYANLEFERLTGTSAALVEGRPWNALPIKLVSTSDGSDLSTGLLSAEDYLGTFAVGEAAEIVVDAWSATIEDEKGVALFRLVALAQISTREGRQEELSRLVQEKDGQLRELQHRVKNNLQMITALIRLEAKNQPGDGTAARFSKLAGRVESLALLYRSLSADDQPDSVDLGVYVSQIASAVMAAQAVEGIHLNLQVDTWPVSLDVAMPTGLVINELLTNSLKHAFVGREQGNITLKCLVDDKGCSITVSDDGIGMDPSSSWPRPGKLSALIVQSLRQNAGATVAMQSSPGAGTRVEIFFARAAAAP